MEASQTEKLRRTIVNLQREEVITTSQVAFCITIPLSKARFEAEKNGVNWWGKLFGIKKEFAKNVADLYLEPYWEGDKEFGYLYRVAMPILQSLLCLSEHTQAVIVNDCKLADCRDILKHGDYRFLILLAYHYDEQIEFADGSASIGKVKAVLESNDRHLSVCLCICESAALADDLKGRQHTGSVAYSHQRSIVN